MFGSQLPAFDFDEVFAVKPAGSEASAHYIEPADNPVEISQTEISQTSFSYISYNDNLHNRNEVSLRELFERKNPR